MRFALALIGLAVPVAATASELAGPARFCGYSPIIDLLLGERITTLDSGIHGGSFRWVGSFGSLTVYGVGWASRPEGRIVKRTKAGMYRFQERREDRSRTVAIWNGRQGAAYFSSNERLTAEQLEAIERVSLYQESVDPSDEPKGCALRTMFSWE